MDQTARHLRLLTETIAAVNSTLDLEEVFDLIARKVAEALETDACFVYLYDEGSDELVRDIQDHVRSRLSAYAYPRKIEFVDDLPKTLTGKIRRIELRQREAEGT